jgi:energy-coupling factor transport system ATP-binding protein
VIRCEGLRVVYPGGPPALDGIDLEIAEGERVGIVGRNGSGKSTLVQTWNGLIRPAAGRVLVDGVDASTRTVAQLARVVGLAFQDPDRQLFARRCREEVAFGARAVGLRGGAVRTAVDEALDAVGLEWAADRHPYDLGRPHRRLLGVACVLAMRTPVVVLDEPTAGQDRGGLERLTAVAEVVRGQGRTLVVVSHDLEFVAGVAERVVVLEAGRLIGDGRTDELLVPSRG